MDVNTITGSIVRLIPALAPYAGYGLTAIGVAAATAPYLPPPALPASGWYPLVYDVVNWLGRNVGHATNVTSPKAIQAQAVPPVITTNGTNS
jgi:hypothetical protein